MYYVGPSYVFLTYMYDLRTKNIRVLVCCVGGRNQTEKLRQYIVTSALKTE